jgi:phage-related protein
MYRVDVRDPALQKFAALPADKQAQIYDHMNAIARVLSEASLPSANPVEEPLWTECSGFRVFYSARANERVVVIRELIPRPLASRA